MACMLPSRVLTAEEKACCREMANQCGDQGMAKSHSCCETVAPPDQSALAKSSFHLSYQVEFLYLPEVTIQVAHQPDHAVLHSAVLDYSPPEAPPISVDILRI
jgi:hypothetical protein